MLRKIISGGQTGADQGGLMAALDHDLLTGGWAPLGYRTNTGPNPLLEAFGLRQAPTSDYANRTRLNIEEADATVILGSNLQSPGSRLTIALCESIDSPFHLVEWPAGPLSPGFEASHVEQLVTFVRRHRVEVLNVAGNRDQLGSTFNFDRTRSIISLLIAELHST